MTGGDRIGMLVLAALLAATAQAQDARKANAATAKPAAPATAAAAASAPAVAAIPGTQGAPQRIDHGLYTGVLAFRPTGAVRDFAFLLSERDAPNDAERALVRTMAQRGAMVAFVPLAPFQRKLEAQGGKCTYAAGAFENLAHQVQAYDKLPTYLEPMLVGLDDGASAAYALLAQAPAGIFASAISLGYCPRIAGRVPPCAGKELRWHPAADGSAAVELEPSTALPASWVALQPPRDANCASAAAQFVARSAIAPAGAASVPGAKPTPVASAANRETFEAAYERLAAERVALEAPPAQLADLPIVEVPTTAPPAAADTQRFAVLLSGDGGWAGIDKAIAASFAKQGIPVAGFDSLRYFWTARTPEGLASDLDRVIRYYAARWKRREVILIGYSQGADVLPFAINRLGGKTRASVKLAALLGLGQKASFEFHVTNWIGPSGDKPIAPEARRLAAANTLCVYGADERDSLCPSLAPQHARLLALPGGHHFGGDYDALAARIREAAGP